MLSLPVIRNSLPDIIARLFFIYLAPNYYLACSVSSSKVKITFAVPGLWRKITKPATQIEVKWAAFLSIFAGHALVV